MRKELFNPSVNILRDKNKDIYYVPTANSGRIYSQIIKDYGVGFHTFSIIGSFGTGKSAFILALEKHLKEKGSIFGNLESKFKQHSSFEFVNIVGDYCSFIDAFSKCVGVMGAETTDEILEQFQKKYKNKYSNRKCLIIIVDEFGKHLEYAAKYEPEREIYFLQKIAEIANDENKNLLLFFVLHQNFDSYGANLDYIRRQEWNKVRGRIRELPFIEPVEQLLSIAAMHITRKKYLNKLPNGFKLLYQNIKSTRILPIDSEISLVFAKKLFPLDILAAAILTLALQKYGQNERSLFSFLLAKDFKGINDYDYEKNKYYNLSSVYDYLSNNYYSFLFTKYNPHYAQWAAIRNSLSRAEVFQESNVLPASKMIKSIGLLNIFSGEGSVLDKEFLSTYAKYSLGIGNPVPMIDMLLEKKIIRFAEYKQKYILFEGTDIDIELVLRDAEGRIEKNKDILPRLKKYFEFPIILAKKVTFLNGIPRFFEFRLTESPIQKGVKKKLDGIINIIFNENISEEEIRNTSRGCVDAILFGRFTNIEEIRNIIWEIDKIEFVIQNTQDDLVAKRELRNIWAYQKSLLNLAIFGSLQDSTNRIRWIFNGEEIKIRNMTELNKTLSMIADKVYPAAPRYRNELINRDRLAPVISLAKKRYFKALVENSAKEEMGFASTKYPPERMIYTTLLKETGIHRKEDGLFILGDPSRSDFKGLWKASQAFIESTKSRRRKVLEFVEILRDSPFGLKDGMISIWIPTFLYIKKDDYSMFIDDRYIPFINDEILEYIIKAAHKTEIKSFSIEGIRYDLFNRYRMLLKKENSKISNQSFIETIKPFIIFYNNLPSYTKQTKRLKTKARNIRDAISRSKDPEATFFEEFPAALGYMNLELYKDNKVLNEFVNELKNAINEIKLSYDMLANQIEEAIFDALSLEKTDLRTAVQKISARYDNIKVYKLSLAQKAFFNSLKTYHPNKTDWISAIVQSLIGKSLDKLIDDDVPIVIDDIREAIFEMNDLYDLSNMENSEQLSKIVKITITAFGEEAQNRVIYLPEKTREENNELADSIKSKLGVNRETNIATLTRLLIEELKD